MAGSKLDEAAAQATSNYGGYAKKIEVTHGVPSVMRVLNMPDGFMVYFESWILCDDEKKRSFIIRNEQGHSLLYSLIGNYDDFYRGGFLESIKDPKTNKPRFIWQSRDIDLFNRIMYNDNISGKDGTWKPTKMYDFNAILRNNTVTDDGKLINWCRENRSSMLLTLKATALKSLQQLKQIEGNPSEYDVAYIKSGSGFETVHNLVKATPEEFPEAVLGELSPEERAYFNWDLAKQTALTPAKVVLERLGNTIERVSTVMGIDWIGQYEEEARVDEEMKAAGGGVTGQTYTSGRVQSSEPNTASAPQQAPQPEEKPAVAPTTVPTSTPQVTPVVTSVVEESAVAVESTPTQVQEPVRRPMRVASDQPQAAIAATEKCYFCKEEIPEGSVKCPKCDNTLQEPCTACNKLFHISLDTCPHCGKKYTVQTV